MSRALPGGMLNSKEKTEYEDWLEKLHKEIDSIKPEKDSCSMPLMDSECGANGCHNYDGSLMTDKNRVHGTFEPEYCNQIMNDFKSTVSKIKDSLCMASYIATRLTEAGEEISIQSKKDDAINNHLKEAKRLLGSLKVIVKNAVKADTLSQGYVDDIEDCIIEILKDLKAILAVKGDINLIKETVREISVETNDFIAEFKKTIENSKNDSILNLKSRNGIMFLNAYRTIKEFDQNVLGGKYTMVSNVAAS